MSRTSPKDVQLLSALANADNTKFSGIVDGLREEASATAQSYDIPSDAVDKAIDKAVDWLRGTEPFKVDHPMAYVKRLIINAIRDYGRTHRERVVSDEDVRGELAWIDERMGYSTEDKGEDDEERMGWHAIRSGEARRGAVPREDYPEHPLLLALRLSTMVRRYDPSVLEGGKAARDKRWAQYKHIMSLIENVPGLRERQVLQQFVWGSRPTDIADMYCISRAYISKVTTKWLRVWGWDKRETDKARVILLTHYCAKAYAKACSEAYPRLLDKIAEGRLLLVPEGIIPVNRWRTAEEKEAADVLYHNILAAPETKAYFGGLPETEDLGLLQVCADYHRLWYGSIGALLPPEPLAGSRMDSERDYRRACMALLRKASVEKRRLYISAWKREASYFGDEAALGILSGLEREYCRSG